jgi:hypothetical protein
VICDRFGAELHAGDAVAVRAEIMGVASEADAYLDLRLTMPPGTALAQRLSLYANQVEKILPGHCRLGAVTEKPLFMSAHQRSPHWRSVREAFLRDHPECAACGGTADLEVHHRRPFHIEPTWELLPANLITLCETPSRHCHFYVGHLLDWHAFNVHIAGDAEFWRKRIRERKYEQKTHHGGTEAPS